MRSITNHKSLITNILVILSIVALLYNCSLDGTCFIQSEVPVIRFELPDSVAKDSVAEIKIVYVTYSNCSKLNSVTKFWSADTLSIHVIADYEGCNCPEVLPDSIATISYKSNVARNYILRAVKYDGTVLQDTLKIFEISEDN